MLHLLKSERASFEQLGSNIEQGTAGWWIAQDTGSDWSSLIAGHVHTRREYGRDRGSSGGKVGTGYLYNSDRPRH